MPTSSAMPASIAWQRTGSSRQMPSKARRRPASRSAAWRGSSERAARREEGGRGERLGAEAEDDQQQTGHGLNWRMMQRAVSPTATSWLAAMAASDLDEAGRIELQRRRQIEQVAQIAGGGTGFPASAGSAAITQHHQSDLADVAGDDAALAPAGQAAARIEQAPAPAPAGQRAPSTLPRVLQPTSAILTGRGWAG